MKIPKPIIKKGKNGRILWTYMFDHYKVMINRFSEDEDVFVTVIPIDPFFPDISEGLQHNFFINADSGNFVIKDKERVINMITEAFELAEILENNLEDLCVAE